jgi:O-acetylserine/cysteine efflux transporter
VVATVIGYGLWNTLLSRHPSSQVAPFSMLVPVVGVIASWLAFGELIDRVELVAGLAVVGGVLYASMPSRSRARTEPEPLPAPTAAGVG